MERGGAPREDEVGFIYSSRTIRPIDKHFTKKKGLPKGRARDREKDRFEERLGASVSGKEDGAESLGQWWAITVRSLGGKITTVWTLDDEDQTEGGDSLITLIR